MWLPVSLPKQMKFLYFQVSYKVLVKTRFKIWLFAPLPLHLSITHLSLSFQAPGVWSICIQFRTNVPILFRVVQLKNKCLMVSCYMQKIQLSLSNKLNLYILSSVVNLSRQANHNIKMVLGLAALSNISFLQWTTG